jgi:hypothetical protein
VVQFLYEEVFKAKRSAKAAPEISMDEFVALFHEKLGRDTMRWGEDAKQVWLMSLYMFSV